MEEEKKAKIFISYATEDKKAAQRLYKKLETAGFSPWRDKENLRGGDKWDDVIEKNIGEVDYFILLQSKALENRVKSVVYEEIEYALKQQSRFRPGIDFIVPVKIEECSCVDNLKDFHTLDLSGDKDFDKMVKDIKRDLEKRKKK